MSKLSKNLDFGQIVGNFRFWSKFTKMSIWDKVAENVDYSHNFRKMSILVNICKYLDFGQNFRNISILVNIYGNLDFGQNWWKSRFWSKLSENLDLGQHFRKISILVNIFGKKFRKYWFWSKFGSNMSILAKNVEKYFPQILVFFSKFWKIFILVKIVGKSQIWKNLSKNLDFGQNSRKLSILVKIYPNVDFGLKMR